MIMPRHCLYKVTSILEKMKRTIPEGVDRDMNFHTVFGLQSLLLQMLRVRPGGFVLISPTCASWVWSSRGTTLRGLAAGISWLAIRLFDINYLPV